MSNVVASWRGRAAALGRQAWGCTACGRLSLARRRVCAGCGQAAGAERAPLPRTGRVVALSPAGAAVEHLDQITGRKPAVLVELAGGERVACLLDHADSVTLAGAVRGQSVRFAVRRMALDIGGREPISYGMKAALDLETRVRVKEEAAQRAAGEAKKEQP